MKVCQITFAYSIILDKVNISQMNQNYNGKNHLLGEYITYRDRHFSPNQNYFRNVITQS